MSASPPADHRRRRDRPLADAGYLADRRLGTAVFLALTLRRPLFLEGEPASARPSSPRRWPASLAAELLRVQCYEGLDIAQTAYEWNVARQMMEIRLPRRRTASATRRRASALARVCIRARC
jgi:MoxR-like ATPase